MQAKCYLGDVAETRVRTTMPQQLLCGVRAAGWQKVRLKFLDVASDKPRPTSLGRSPRERVTLTVRLESDIVAALIRASAERKIRQETPYTQQDIISEALKQWLHEAGFWSELVCL